MDRVALTVARGGSEMKEKLKKNDSGLSVPGHELYKKKIDEYIKSPTPPAPPAQNKQCFDDLTDSLELPCLDADKFILEIPEGMTRTRSLVLLRALSYSVYNETEFQFLKRNPGNDDRFFSQLLVVYGNVINPWDN